jgi:hypothetical protein
MTCCLLALVGIWKDAEAGLLEELLLLTKNLLARHEIQWFDHHVLKSPPFVTTLSQIWSPWGVEGSIIYIIFPFVNTLHFSSEWLAHCL